MSSKEGAADAPLCQIGERVYLVADALASRFENAFGNLVMRSLDLAVGDRRFHAYQLTEAPDVAGHGGSWTIADLETFPALCALGTDEQCKLVAVVFRLVAQTFGLRKDPVLRASFDALLAVDGMPRGRIAARTVRNLDTVVCEVPNRLRLAAGNLLIAYDDQLSLGTFKAVEPVIGDDEDRKVAVIDCSRPLPGTRALVVTKRGLVAADIDMETAEDIPAFAESSLSALPDFANLLAIWDDTARAGLGAWSRSQARSSQIAISSLGLRFNLTHSVSMDHGLFLSGWFWDQDGLLEDAWAVDHGLKSQALMAVWKLLPARADIDGVNQPVRQFHAFLPRTEGVAAPSGLSLRLRFGNGESHLIHVPDCRFSRLMSRSAILDSATGRRLPPATVADVFQPAVAPVQALLNQQQGVDEMVDFGRPSSRKLSLIIPLYRELRFVRSQLVAFNTDPFIRDHCQIVYSVDDPLIANRFRQIISGIEHIFTLDVRIVFLARNGGYALANNFAASEADGEFVVLMNSDVIPQGPGWLEPMIERLNALPPRSVIGPRLLYADSSLQHAGMYFYRTPDGYWQNYHFFKGYGEEFAAANVEREVPAVTGALMLLRRDDFLSVGGFTSDYVIGDYEDSDLCLKLRAQGGTCLYMPSIALYHFERQSMPGADSDVDAGSTIYNRAIHTARWSETILELMSAHAGEVRYGV